MSSGPGQSAGPPVAVVVCTRNRPHLLSAALIAVKAAVRPQDEILVVDSASDGTQTMEVAANAGVRALRVERPGLSIARNAGLGATSAPVVAFTDDDCLPQAGWTETLSAAFVDPAVGLALGRLVAERADGDMPMPDTGDRTRRFARGVDPAALGSGANMAFRRTAIAEVGGFDAALGAGTAMRSGEDHDAFWRVLHAGWYGAYDPAAVVLHAEWRNRWQLVRMGWGYGLGAGALAAKIGRTDRRAGSRMLARRVGPEGLGKVVSCLVKRWERPALANLLYTGGVVAGAARTWRRTLKPAESRS